MFTKDPDGFDLVITDQTMPDLTGIKLTEEMVNIRPDLPVILCTGFSKTLDREEARRVGVREIIMKPYVYREIAAVIRKLLDPE